MPPKKSLLERVQELAESLKNEEGDFENENVEELISLFETKLKNEEEARQRQLEIESLQSRLAELGVHSGPAFGGVAIKNENLESESEKSQEMVRSKSTKVDFSWVMACEGKGDFRRFSNTFLSLAKTCLEFIPEESHPNIVDAALEIAFSKGKFQAGLDDLEIYKKKGIHGYDLVEMLRGKYVMHDCKALAIAQSNFNSIKRERGEQLYDCIQRFTRMQTKVEVLLPDNESLGDRELRNLFRKMMYESEFKEAYAECREIAREDPDVILSGEGVDKYTFSCWLSAAERVALTQMAAFVPSSHRQERAYFTRGKGGPSRDVRPPSGGHDVRCYVCGEKGHYAVKCPQRMDRPRPSGESESKGNGAKAATDERDDAQKRANAANARGRGRGRGNGRGRGFGRSGSSFQKGQPSPQ